ncbi:fimbria/pilus outer membrane usher protein [Trabulsiella odontotermitis]|uniref:Fimbrial assembly protein n=1 Tax=Trabulsiella odontotermitis TaxID=379893 RepID=A0A0L0H338_9ENTR|nr:fimbria/pilus outer membrane usher protein [Trabulsiella odontotermitis]KNC95587.1 fimbrial assembly protein [Trabulsiella odontotermitis]
MKALKRSFFPRPGRLAISIALATTPFINDAHARDYFNPALLEIDNPAMKGADLSAFERGGQAPGTWRVDVIINDRQVDTREVTFYSEQETAGEPVLKPCLSVALVQSYGVKTEQYPALATQGKCANLTAIPQASSEFLFNTQKLLLSIPQAALSPVARGYVAPELWDEGINAVMLNYMLSGANTRARDQSADSNSQYANLRPGINIGPWRFRNYTTWNRDSQGQNQWDSVYSYAQRNIVPLKAQLTLGDSNAPADVFDSMPFRGGQLASDDDMLPESMKGYAPVVRGIARTNAQVIIRQNGYVINQNYVAPGAFEISDMYSTGGSGDLNVTLKEADGSEQTFTVPYASLPVLQREGRLKYAVTGGQYRSYDSRVDKTPFGQITAILGLPVGFTVYGGLQQSSKYQSIAGGVGKNLGEIGAVSTDITQAWSQPQDEKKQTGQSWRIRYSKNIVATSTNFTIAGYRYSTGGYYSMQEVLDSWGENHASGERRRNRMEVTLSQSLGDRAGSLTMSAVREDYWHSPHSASSLGVGYNNSWQGISYGINGTWSKNGGTAGGRTRNSQRSDQLISLNVSIPLERFLSNTWANYAMNISRHSSTTHTVGLNGMALEGNALNWSVQQGYGTDDVGYTGSANVDYRGTYAETTAGYSYDRSGERLNYGLAGGILAHADGITFSQPLGETNVLVKAPGASGVGVNNQSGVKTDYHGYTVTSNVSPYRKNDIGLNTATLPDDVELELTNKTVVPTRGAVVRADYVANVGSRALLTLVLSNQQPVPFGARVSIAGNEGRSAIVDEGGQVYLTGLAAQGVLNVVWDQENTQRCQVRYSLDGNNNVGGISLARYTCH